jgi:hypothetical protein
VWQRGGGGGGDEGWDELRVLPAGDQGVAGAGSSLEFDDIGLKHNSTLSFCFKNTFYEFGRKSELTVIERRRRLNDEGHGQRSQGWPDPEM